MNTNDRIYPSVFNTHAPGVELGLTKREWLIGQALIGITSWFKDIPVSGDLAGTIAGQSIAIADAVIKQLQDEIPS